MENSHEPWRTEQRPVPTVTPSVIEFEPDRMIHALRLLGILKVGEAPRVLHQHGCAFPKNRAAGCSCVGGAEILWPDHDELSPLRHCQIPARFSALA
jgi:hypothetical protein